MIDFLSQLFSGVEGLIEPLMDNFERLLVALVTSGAALVGLIVVVFACWVTLSESLRREQRARCFLRLLEIGLRQGRTLEETVASLARARVREMGVAFHQVAAWMQRGMRLSAALREVPRFLPGPVAAMLTVGEQTEDVLRVLPACTATLRGGAGQSNRQTNDFMVMFMASPVGPIVIWMVTIWVMPRMREIGLDMGLPFDPVPEFCVQAGFWIGALTTVVWLVLWLMEMGRTGGRWLFRGLVRPIRSVLDHVNFRVSWVRRRVQRDFASLLASLLDSGVPEARAVELAGEATDNRAFQSRVLAVLGHLRDGVPLPCALGALDRSGEFQWRLENAAAAGRGFSSALAGWQESLEARAFQEEQAFSQLLSTSLVLLNGLMVALAAVGMFHFLINLMEVAS